MPSSPWSRIPPHLFDQTLTRSLSAQQTRLYHASHTHRHNQPNSATTSNKPESQHQPISSLPTTSDPDLPHLTTSQKVHMTQIHEKAITHRLATSTCTVWFSNPRPWSLLSKGQHATKKGDVFSVARIAGIMAAKKTPDIVPLCHPGIGITGVEVDVRLVPPEGGDRDKEYGQVAGLGKEAGEEKRSDGLYADGDGGRYGAMKVVATVSCQGRTGVEMEAMTATVSAALTVYDMLKAVDKGMVVGDVKLLEKLGGKSGHWIREKEVEQ